MNPIVTETKQLLDYFAQWQRSPEERDDLARRIGLALLEAITDDEPEEQFAFACTFINSWITGLPIRPLE